MEEKTIQRIKKLQALAERGVGGEKETAAKMLQRLLEKNGISTLEELEEDEAVGECWEEREVENPLAWQTEQEFIERFEKGGQ